VEASPIAGRLEASISFQLTELEDRRDGSLAPELPAVSDVVWMPARAAMEEADP
jgi:hypothetical protein